MGMMKEQMNAAQLLGIDIASLPVREPKDIDAAFETAKRKHVQGLLTNPAPQITTVRGRILEFAAKNRFPAMYPESEYTNAGGLVLWTEQSRTVPSRCHVCGQDPQRS